MASIVFDSDTSGNFEIYVMDLADGAPAPVQLSNDPRFDSFWPKLSPDGTQIIFHRAPRGVHDQNFFVTSTWKMNLDGSGLTRLLKSPLDPGGNENGWIMHGHVEWAPDGQRLLFGSATAAEVYPQIVQTDLQGRLPQQVTNQLARHIDPSYHPSGKAVVYCRAARDGNDDTLGLYAQDLASQSTTALLSSGAPAAPPGSAHYDPYHSPDGTMLAWLCRTGLSPAGQQNWDILMFDRTGQVRNLTAGRNNVDAPFGSINSKPSWSQDSKLIIFHGMRYGIDAHFRLWSIDPLAPLPHLTIRPIETGLAGACEYPDW
jgi:Tol biopolymer transport system component